MSDILWQHILGVVIIVFTVIRATRGIGRDLQVLLERLDKIISTLDEVKQRVR